MESNAQSQTQTESGADHDEKDKDGSSPENSHEGTPADKQKSGRRKIQIEFIEDKSRRHITFSKRKAGIMKKAYELSTLTGTQVLLLVASETGHVYTFATPKLQPLITKADGKNLIQACLNAPDTPSTSQTTNTTARMSAGSQNMANYPEPPASNYGNDGDDDKHASKQQDKNFAMQAAIQQAQQNAMAQQSYPPEYAAYYTNPTVMQQLAAQQNRFQPTSPMGYPPGYPGTPQYAQMPGGNAAYAHLAAWGGKPPAAQGPAGNFPGGLPLGMAQQQQQQQQQQQASQQTHQAPNNTQSKQ